MQHHHNILFLKKIQKKKIRDDSDQFDSDDDADYVLEWQRVESEDEYNSENLNFDKLNQAT